MIEEFVTFEIAKKLEENGYPQIEKSNLAMYDVDGKQLCELCSLESFNDTNYACPTISQVLKWLRKEKNLFVCIDVAHIIIPMKGTMDKYSFYITNLINQDRDSSFEKFDSPELAAIAAIEYALNYLIEEN